MIDAQLRRYIDPPFNRIAASLKRTSITANQVTITGFVIGLAVIPALALHLYCLAIVIIVINRFSDGLDGAIARKHEITDDLRFTPSKPNHLFDIRTKIHSMSGL